MLLFQNKIFNWLIPLLITIGFCLLNACTIEKCKITEVHDNGNPRIIICLLEGANNTYNETYHLNGQLESSFTMIMLEIEGQRKDYFSSGALKSISNYHKGKKEGKETIFYENGNIHYKESYKNGKRNGEKHEYDKKGNLTNFFIYSDDLAVYGKSFKTLNGKSKIHEAYAPIVTFEKDSISKLDSIFTFEVNLPIPDSLFTDHELYFAYGFKDKSLKDSLLKNPSYQISITNNQSEKIKLKIKPQKNQFFYCYLADKEFQNFFEPTEKEIFLK